MNDDESDREPELPQLATLEAQERVAKATGNAMTGCVAMVLTPALLVGLLFAFGWLNGTFHFRFMRWPL